MFTKGVTKVIREFLSYVIEFILCLLMILLVICTFAGFAAIVVEIAIHLALMFGGGRIG